MFAQKRSYVPLVSKSYTHNVILYVYIYTFVRIDYSQIITFSNDIKKILTILLAFDTIIFARIYNFTVK